MTYQVHLTDAERDLLVEMLETERIDLPSERRHTDAASVKAELHRRQELIRTLLDKLTAVPAT